VVDRLIGDCATPYSGADLKGLFAAFQSEYGNDTSERRRMISVNYAAALDRMGKVAIHPMRLDAGFNVAVTLPAMVWSNEDADQHRLAHDHGVGVLPEGCFRSSHRTTGNYFFRLGLTLPPAEFGIGLDIVREYYRV
jgi:DNA-binding transcriptional MocR family regulator